MVLLSSNKKLLILLLLASSPRLFARKWRDTGGTIVLEEAWTIPELVDQVGNTTAAFGGTNAELRANLLDVHNQRLQGMDASNIDFMVLSCSTPCIQGIADPVAAAEMAVTVNDRLAAVIANNTERFGGFASLAMHNATVAALELERAIKQLGFLGMAFFSMTISNLDLMAASESFLLHSTYSLTVFSKYDVFWQKLSDLDVPLYLHPRNDVDPIVKFQYAHAPFLEGPAQEYAAVLSNHILGICVNGVFDRFPKAQLIAGHFGERIPSDLIRIDTQLLRQIVLGLPMKKNITTYFRENIFETSSGNFATNLLNFHIGEIGLDRIMYSIDYPYVAISDGTAWVNTLPNILGKQNFNSFARQLAIEILRLND
ncbi:hypothetical protein BDZ97DRAFT_1755084 [Flammula alnicola]|nr:hypothetical protein BDZ97DRAFT_1755084 [Flammula alnicola]